MLRQILVLLVSFVAPAALLAAQPSALQKGGAPPAVSGRASYEAFCASCHGADGKGMGPAASTLRVKPSDLTTLTSRNHGTFPTLHVREAIDGEYGIPSHGSKAMPVWGPVFRSMAHGHDDNAQLRIANLAKYIESLQQKEKTP